MAGGCSGCAFPPRNPRGPFVPQAAPLCSSQTRTHHLSFRVWTKALVDITECTYSQIPREFFSKSKYVCVLAFQLDFKQDLCFLHLRFFPIFSNEYFRFLSCPEMGLLDPMVVLLVIFWEPVFHSIYTNLQSQQRTKVPFSPHFTNTCHFVSLL